MAVNLSRDIGSDSRQAWVPLVSLNKHSKVVDVLAVSP